MCTCCGWLCIRMHRSFCARTHMACVHTCTLACVYACTWFTTFCVDTGSHHTLVSRRCVVEQDPTPFYYPVGVVLAILGPSATQCQFSSTFVLFLELTGRVRWETQSSSRRLSDV
jgi:hypothetical protein